MASGHVTASKGRTHGCTDQCCKREESSCQLGAVHTWHITAQSQCAGMSATGESGFASSSSRLAWTLLGDYISRMCGRIIQSSGPLRYAIVDGMNVRDSRVHNYPPRWNAAPSHELLVIRRNRRTGEVSLDPLRWGLIPY